MHKKRLTLSVIGFFAALALSACATQRKPTTAYELLVEARDAVAVNQYDTAVSKLKQAHKIKPLDARILYDIAQIRYAQGQYTKAAYYARKAIRHASATHLFEKSNILLTKAKSKSAANVANKTIPLASGNYIFQLKYAEHPMISGGDFLVTIQGDHITISNPHTEHAFPKGVITQGKLVWNRHVKKWIIATEAADRHAKEAGSCTDGPDVVDLDKKIYWTC